MPDVLSSGFPEHDEEELVRPAAPRPRWLSGAALLGVAALAAVLAVRQGTGRPDAPRPEPSRPAPTRALPPVAATTPPDRGPLPAAPVYRLDGDPGYGPAGVRLAVGGREPGLLDAATGRLDRLPAPGLPAGDSTDVRRGPGVTVVLVGTGTLPQPRVRLVPDRGATVDLGGAIDVLPRRDGSLVAERCTPDPPLCSLAGRSRTGATLWSRPVPGFLDLLADTPYGLLVGVRDGAGDAELRLIEPRAGTVRRTFGRAAAVLGTSDRRVAWRPAGCDSSCPVLVADLAGGRTRQLPASAGRAVTGAFSADSELLAVGFAGLDPNDPDRSDERDGFAAVLDLRRPGWFRAPGLVTGAKSAPVPVWTPGGELLLAVQDGRGTGRVAVWRPGAARLTVLPTRLAGFDAVPREFTAAP